VNLYDLNFNMKLFFAAILLGFIIGLLGSYFLSLWSLNLDYSWNYEWAINKKKKDYDEIERLEFLKKKSLCLLIVYALILVISFFVVFSCFEIFVNNTNQIQNSVNVEENVSCLCNNSTLNKYNLIINQITINKRHQEFSIKELEYLINGKIINQCSNLRYKS
jgi:hypothetical protein